MPPSGTEDWSMGTARADNILGPWTKYVPAFPFFLLPFLCPFSCLSFYLALFLLSLSPLPPPDACPVLSIPFPPTHRPTCTCRSPGRACRAAVPQGTLRTRSSTATGPATQSASSPRAAAACTSIRGFCCCWRLLLLMFFFLFFSRGGGIVCVCVFTPVLRGLWLQLFSLVGLVLQWFLLLGCWGVPFCSHPR